MLPNFKNKCICCETTTNLNTIMQVNIAGHRLEVAICDEHAEEVTVKKVHQLVTDKIRELGDLLEKIKGYGITLQENKTGLIIPETKAELPKTEPVETETESEPAPESVPEPTKPAKSGLKVTFNKNPLGVTKQPKLVPRSLTMSGQGVANIEKHEALNIEALVESASPQIVDKGGKKIATPPKAPVSEIVEMQTVRGRGGAPMTIPKKIRGAGATQISIVNTGGDKALQERFKAIAKEDEPVCYGKDGYDELVDCTMCGGTGITKIGNKTCPKCKGAGSFNRR